MYTHTCIITAVCVVIVMASDSQIKARRQAGKVWRGKLLFGVSFHVARGQMEGESVEQNLNLKTKNQEDEG